MTQAGWKAGATQTQLSVLTDARGFPRPVGPREVRPSVEERGRWLLTFLESDLASLSRSALKDMATTAAGFVGARPRTSLATLPVLTEWQHVARVGLRSYFDGEGWRFRGTVTGKVVWHGEVIVFREVLTGDNPDGFSWFALATVVELGPRLRHCEKPDCKRLFVAERRQTYCSRKCSDQVRMARFREAVKADPARSAAIRKANRERYRREKQKDLPHAKVGRGERRTEVLQK